MAKHRSLEVLACILGMAMAFTVGMTAMLTGRDGVVVGAVCTALGLLVGSLLRGPSPAQAAPKDKHQATEKPNT